MTSAEKPVAEEVIWLRPERARKGPRPTLSREDITRAAIELGDSDGLEAVSMRRIAAKLGAGATSLYWYVSNKDDLYELMVDEIFGEVRLPRPSGDWKADLRTLARNTHTVLRRHGWMVLLGIQPGLGPNVQHYGEVTLAIFDGLDVDLSTKVNILALVNNYVFGFGRRETFWQQLRQRSGLNERQWLERYLRQARELDREVAPRVAARLELAGESSFQFGLDCLLEGVAAHIAG